MKCRCLIPSDYPNGYCSNCGGYQKFVHPNREQERVVFNENFKVGTIIYDKGKQRMGEICSYSKSELNIQYFYKNEKAFKETLDTSDLLEVIYPSNKSKFSEDFKKGAIVEFLNLFYIQGHFNKNYGEIIDVSKDGKSITIDWGLYGGKDTIEYKNSEIIVKLAYKDDEAIFNDSFKTDHLVRARVPNIDFNCEIINVTKNRKFITVLNNLYEFYEEVSFINNIRFYDFEVIGKGKADSPPLHYDYDYDDEPYEEDFYEEEDYY
ncbi:hypothetical protein JOC95_001902 [Bacillus tianshenii]|uniref:Uncharacterized protein n=1 Tax=Sutcliffiella tianshenii TaxID=1463404 RepID=A0ABS2NZB4_9BACI|nr:hypothetical protein [Bacillus tianshenii]MBM7620050.1 hypothetical protein [Bacillus tianshenii]